MKTQRPRTMKSNQESKPKKSPPTTITFWFVTTVTPKSSPKVMKWIEALKVWNEQHSADLHGTWCVPRKGTAGHQQVLAIMKGSATAGTAATEAADSGSDTAASPEPTRYRTLRGRQGNTHLIFN